MGRKNIATIYYFLAKIKVNPHGCWEWLGQFTDKGYAKFSEKRKNITGHRFSYKFFIGEIPKDKQVHHKCENKSCTNPEHLKLLSVKEHIMTHGTNAAAKNAKKTHCRRGHIFNEINTFFVRGTRQCRECSKIRCKNWRIRKKIHNNLP